MDMCLVLAGDFIWPKDGKALALLEIVSNFYIVVAYQKDAGTVNTYNCDQAQVWYFTCSLYT